MQALELKNLFYKYPGTKDFILKDINLKIPKNSFYVLTGPTGCGKTTLLMLARGFYKEWGGDLKGRILALGQDIKDKNISELGTKIGIIFQDPALQLHQLKVIDEVMSAPMYQNLPFPECRRRAEDLIKEILNENFFNMSPNEISSGEQQKVALAAVLAMDCDVLLLDEPFSFLDVKSTKEILNLLVKLKKKGKTIVIATHNLEQVARYADRIALMSKGKIVMEGKTREVLYSKKLEEVLAIPSSIRVAKSLKLRNVIDWLGLRDTKLKINKEKVKEQKQLDLIELDNISYSYNGRLALDNISLSVKKGEIFGLIGPNGSGKTTIAKIILGLLKPKNGNIILNGKNITKLETYERARKIGYVTQNPIEMLFESSVLLECSFGPKCLGMKDPEERAKKTLEILSLIKYKDKHPDSLSGGERSKLAIADILVNEPEVLLLDEPEFGLDMKSWGSIVDIIKELKKKGKTIIIITHDMEIASVLCDRLALLKDGKLISVGKPEEICSDNMLKKSSLEALPFYRFLPILKENV